jgi:dTDP-4-amino-4,6-dideoxygalactose transaminase
MNIGPSDRTRDTLAAAPRLPSDADWTGRGLGWEEISLLLETISSGTLNCTRGTQVSALEREFAEVYGVEHARAVSSGTAAIHAAIAAIDPEPGDEIVTTPVTDMGAIAPILYQQAIPVFADLDPLTLNLTADRVAQRLTTRTRAIIATHLFGRPCDIIAIRRVADEYGIPVIEDCAQAYLASVDGRLVGTFGAIGTFSLQQGKHMTCGEGGLVITADAERARRMKLFSDKAWGYGDPSPDHTFLALNYRMTDLQGAVARAQLRKLRSVVARRRHSAARLTELLADVSGLTLPEDPPGGTHTYWRYPLFLDTEVIPGGADALGAELLTKGVACAPRYIKKPAFACEMFTRRRTYGASGCPFSCRERMGGGRVEYDERDYPGTMEGLSRIVVLSWNEFYGDQHVEFIAGTIRAAVRRLQTRSSQAG